MAATLGAALAALGPSVLHLRNLAFANPCKLGPVPLSSMGLIALATAALPALPALSLHCEYHCHVTLGYEDAELDGLHFEEAWLAVPARLAAAGLDPRVRVAPAVASNVPGVQSLLDELVQSAFSGPAAGLT